MYVYKRSPVFDLLPQGAENAVPGRILVEVFGFNSDTELRKQVSKERIAGAFILSNERGYFLPSNGLKGVDEIDECYFSLERRTKAMSKAIEPMGEFIGQAYAHGYKHGIELSPRFYWSPDDGEE